MPPVQPVELFTDGACLGNPGPGGWGAVLRWREHEKELSGGEPLTTNNRMELMAAIEGLAAVKRPSVDSAVYRLDLSARRHNPLDCRLEAQWLAHGRPEAGKECRPLAASGRSRGSTPESSGAGLKATPDTSIMRGLMPLPWPPLSKRGQAFAESLAGDAQAVGDRG